MKYRIAKYTIFFLLLINLLFAGDSSNIQKIISQYMSSDSNKNDYYSLIFYNDVNCMRCLASAENLINYLKMKIHKNIIKIYFIRCDRSIELKEFKKNYHWINNIEVDIKGKTRKKLNLSTKNNLYICDTKGNVLFMFNYLIDLETNKRKVDDYVHINNGKLKSKQD